MIRSSLTFSSLLPLLTTKERGINLHKTLGNISGKYRTESTLRETRSWLAAREEELSRVEADLHNTGRERGQLESRLRGEEQMSKELGARILDLEREAEEKEKSAGSTRDSNQQLSTQMQELHAKLKEKTDTVVR